MKMLLVLSMAIATTASTLACGDYASFPELSVAALDCSGQTRLTLDDLTRNAVGTDKTKAENAIRMLRARGPEGLRALLEANAAVMKERVMTRPLLTAPQPDDSWQRVKAALDGVSGQRDCHASQLYWYTDFEQAKAAAKAQAKPILSLRLLGRLDEEFSCANSRFFRTTLYANRDVSSFLRDHYVLHWKSVRPVPKVTIDFGDGRKLEQTITGNSIHYVLNADGEVVDALPGLYGPKTFLRELERAGNVSRDSIQLTGPERESFFREFHRARLVALIAELAADLQQVSYSATPRTELTPAALVQPGANAPDARTASRTTGANRQMEHHLLRPTALKSSDLDEATWKQIAALHADSAKLDENSRALIQAKSPTAFIASRLAIAKRFTESPLLRQIRNLERSISEDTVRNEYSLHTQIHEWLARGTAPVQVDALNAKVYAELFLTPDSDPWLGLLPDDAYTALENDGIVVPTSETTNSFGIYLTAEPVDRRILTYGKGDWSRVRLSESPLISGADIISYDFTNHSVRLRPEAFARIPRPPVEGTPFVVVAGGQRIYLGAFTTPISSMSFAVPTITVHLVTNQPTNAVIIIERGYTDPRGDPRIKAALKALQKM